MVFEVISCGSGTLIVMVAWRRSCVAFLRHRCQIAGAEFRHRHTSVPIWHSHAFGVDCRGIYECCLKLFLLVLVAGMFRHCSRVERLLKIHMDSPLFIVLLRIRRILLQCGYGKFHYCSSRQTVGQGGQ